MLGMFYPVVSEEATSDHKFMQIGNNTGNNVFWTALRRILPIERIPYDYEEKGVSLDSYDAIITTDLIWIREGDNFPFLESLIKKTTRPIIPISIGLQSNSLDLEFKFSKRTISLLKRLEERGVLGVRGDYTAAVLKKNDIKNIAVIGCPSMYYWNNPALKIEDNILHPNNYICNFRTFYGSLNRAEKRFLSFSAGQNALFVEQTNHEFEPKHANDDAYYTWVAQWLKKEKKCFFSVEEWMRETCLYDFSMGGRFHGNVVSLWNNIKSLFIISDSRTRELTSYFMLPTISFEKFDWEKDIKYYYDLADYSQFNRRYPQCFSEFVNFLQDNSISIPESVPCLQFAGTNRRKLEYEEKVLANDINKIKCNVEKKEEHEFVKCNIEAIEQRRKGNDYIKMISALPILDEFDYYSTGRYSLRYSSTDIDIMYKNNQSDRLVVLLSAGIVNTDCIPEFQRWSYSSYLRENVLCIADPMYKEYEDKGLLVGWYYGNEEHCYLDCVIDLVEKIAQKNSIRRENIIFYGSSAGGYAGIYCANKIQGSCAIAWNAQFRISEFHYSKIFEKITGNSLEKDALGRNDITEMILTESRSKILLLENIRSSIDIKQIEILLGGTKELRYGKNIVSPNVMLVTYDAGTSEKAHGVTDRKWIMNRLIDLMQKDWNEYDVSCEIDTLIEALNDAWNKS
ncbi:MAG: polysaccharide pyruvyl transferase family protein [Roseburia sp.]|nr:polysaccharide pyruvyl transferase family protein [Roseburia sp.]